MVRNSLMNMNGMRSVTIPTDELMREVVKLLAENQQVTIKAKGNSMLPFIAGGKDSVVLLKEATYRKGDIVLAEIAKSSFVLHRIMSINDEGVTLMGDGNVSGVEKCRNNAIHGRAIAIIRKEKRVDCTRKWERFKARAWAALLPVRRYLLAIYRRIG